MTKEEFENINNSVLIEENWDYDINDRAVHSKIFWKGKKLFKAAYTKSDNQECIKVSEVKPYTKTLTITGYKEIL